MTNRSSTHARMRHAPAAVLTFTAARQHGANNLGGPKDSATSELGLAPVIDATRRDSGQSGRMTPSNGGSLRGALAQHDFVASCWSLLVLLIR